MVGGVYPTRELSPGTITAVFRSLFSSLAVLLLVVACSVDVPNLDSPGTTIVCFGDSITYGVGGSPGRTYPEILAGHLGTEIINAGVPGETAADGTKRLDEVLAEDPWLVVVELGGNDLLQKRPLAETEEALRFILEGLLEAQVVPVLVEIRGPFGSDMGDLYRNLAKDYGVPLLEDVLPKILLTPRLKADPIHPNGDGYEKLALEVAGLLRPILEAREGLP